MFRVVFLQLFWISFTIIGLAALISWKQLRPSKRNSTFFSFIESTDPLIAFLILFSIGIAIFIPVVAAAYFLEWSVYVVTTLYLVSLLLSLFVTVTNWDICYEGLRRIYKHAMPHKWLAIVALVLVADYAFALQLGGALHGDAWVHISKINQLMSGHFTLADPYFSQNGVIDARYSTNLLHALEAVAATLLRVPATTIWLYSYAFFRLLVWLSLFAVVYIFIDKRVRQSWSYLVLTITPLFFAAFFRYAELPDRIVLVWIALFLVGIKIFLEANSSVLLLIAAALIAVTHSLNALMALGFLLLLVATLAITRNLTRRQLTIFIAIMLILAVPVAINIYYPNRLAGSFGAFNAGAISGTDIKLNHIGNLLIPKLRSPITLTTALVLSILALYFYFGRFLKNRRLKLLFLVLTLSCALLYYNPLYPSLIGYYVLWKVTQKNSSRLLILLLVFYYGLIAYNPIFWTLLHAQVPPWVVSRFSEFNILGFVAPIIGVLALFDWLFRSWGFRRIRPYTPFIVGVIIVVVIPLVTGYKLSNVVQQNRAVEKEDMLENSYETQKLDELKTMKPELENQLVYSSDPITSIRLPMVMQTNVIDILVAAHSPMSNIKLRHNCDDALRKSLYLSDLQTAGVTRVLVDTTSNNATAFLNLVHSKSYLLPQKSLPQYRLFSVNYDLNVKSNNGMCSIPRGN